LSAWRRQRQTALDINRELEALDLPLAMQKEKADLTNRIADELRRLEQALRGVKPEKRLKPQFRKVNQ
jgi:hypothetical protein